MGNRCAHASSELVQVMPAPHRNGQPIKQEQRGQSPAWKCPTCVKRALFRVKKSYSLVDGTVIPKLDRLQCQLCKEEILDSPAMDVIEEFRKLHPLKKTSIKRHKKVWQLDRTTDFLHIDGRQNRIALQIHRRQCEGDNEF